MAQLPEGSEHRVSRRRLLKRVAVGGGVVYAAPFMTSAALAGPTTASPAVTRPAGLTVPPSADRTRAPTSSRAAARSRRARSVRASRASPATGTSRAEASASATRCSSARASSRVRATGDCPPGWACASSCCPGVPGLLCLPPCGTSPDRRCRARGWARLNRPAPAKQRVLCVARGLFGGPSSCLERTTGVEPATPGLGSQCSTTELRPRAAHDSEPAKGEAAAAQPPPRR